MSTVPCHRGGSACKWPACDQTCDGRPGRGWAQEQIDDHMLHDDHDDVDQQDYFDADCGLMSDGQCSQAGTEHCDFGCPNRNSDLFVGSAAWRNKYNR